jgi:hypothetical protein
MKTLFDRATEVLVSMVAPLKKHLLVYRALGVMLAVTLYAAGVLLVDRATDVGFVVVLVALYFLPAVLRAWLLFYWQLRDELNAWRGRRAGGAM